MNRILKPKDKSSMTRSVRSGDSMSEKDLQSLCEQYLHLHNLPFLHIPAQTLNAAFHKNNRLTGVELGAARAASEYIKGWPDLTVFYKGRWRMYELKSRRGVLSQAQRQRQKEFNIIIIRNFEIFEKDIQDFIHSVDLENAYLEVK